MATKTCTICGETQPIENFKKHKACVSGYVSRCKQCVNRLNMEADRRKGVKTQVTRTAEEKKATKSSYQKNYYQMHRKRLSDYQRTHKEANPELAARQHRSWYRNNRDKILVDAREYRIKNADHIREWRKRTGRRKWLKHYGLTVEQYEAMVQRQGNCCAICGNGPTIGKTLCVDHDHRTGKVRGLLCNTCNVGMGALKDDPELVWLAFAYLVEYADDDNTSTVAIPDSESE